MQMTTRFKLVENGVFLGSAEIPNAIYEWQMPNQKRFGKLRVRLVVLDGPPRRFYLEPILQAAMDKEYATKFILKACNSGYKLLKNLEKHGHAETLAYKMYAALFRNRHEGRFRVARKFSSPRDFVDFNPSQGQPSLITPGLELNPRNKVD